MYLTWPLMSIQNQKYLYGSILTRSIRKMVKAELCNQKYIFKAGDEVFEWCGEFKQPIFQGIVNDVSASLARVGFDSFEWLRQRKS